MKYKIIQVSGNEITKCPEWSKIKRLCYKEGLFYSLYCEASDNELSSKYKFTICYYKGKPINVTTIRKNKNCEIMSFTHGNFRRKNIAKITIKKAIKNNKINKKQRLKVYSRKMNSLLKSLNYNNIYLLDLV